MKDPLTTVARSAPPESVAALTRDSVPPLLAQIYAARGITSARELADDTAGLLPVSLLHNAERMACILADAIAERSRLLIISDYDSDGATACAVGLRALRAFGAVVDFLVPNRFEYGYGLTPELADLAKKLKNPQLLITVDNGIASIEGVARANQLNMPVLVTDHHLPGTELPEALCIVNPNQPDCAFPSKNLAGVGVMFYVMLALRAELRRRGWFSGRSDDKAARPTDPNLSALLDLVALGTVADVVRLDQNNRILVQQGLKRIRAGKTWPGLAALMNVAGRVLTRASTYDLGFVLGPRLNAAGRLDDMSLGIECLTSDDPTRAGAIARELDQLNRERRSIEAGMQENALAIMERVSLDDRYSVCLYDPEWHQGVIGILASRIKERYHRPVIAFARGADGELKGSGRSITALHLRDALDLVAKREPGMLSRFGGHAAAAGLTLREADFERFCTAFEAVVRAQLTPADLRLVIETDGALAPEHLTIDAARLLEGAVWGQGFPAPVFEDEFKVLDQRVVGERHLKLSLGKHGVRYEAMLFSHAEPLPGAVHAVYRIAVNEYNGAQKLQLTIEQWRPAG